MGAVAEMLRKRDQRDGPQITSSRLLLACSLGVAVQLPPVFVLPIAGAPALTAVLWTVYGCFVGALVIVADRWIHRGIPRGPKETAGVRSVVLRVVLFTLCMTVLPKVGEVFIRTGSFGTDLLVRCAFVMLGTLALFRMILPRPPGPAR